MPPTHKNKGYKTAVNIMQISNLSNNELNEIGILATDCMVDIIYFADSLGSISPDNIKMIELAIWNARRLNDSDEEIMYLENL